MNVIVKLFSTPKGKYVYDRETNAVLSLNDDEHMAFHRIQENKATADDLKLLKIFQERGFCAESVLKKIEHPQNKYLKFYLENKIDKITLQVTQNCNLRCSYCIYSGKYHQRSHANKVMSYETMRKSVDFLVRHSNDSKQVDIGFYGGEPLLEFKNIKKLVEYVKQMYPYKEITFTITTNGTQFTDEIIDFLSANRFNVSVSIDGPKEIHNQNRVFANGEGSFDKMMSNLQYIKNKNEEFFKKISFVTVIAPGSDYQCVSDFYSANEVMEDNYFTASTVSEPHSKEEIRYDERYFIAYNIQRTKMLLSLLGLIGKDQISKLLSGEVGQTIRFYKDLGMGSLTATAHPGGPCIPGAKRAMVDVNGYLYPCERVSESSVGMRMGHIDSGFDLSKAKAILNIGQLSEQECTDCWNFMHCGLCAVAADDTKEFSKTEKLKHCERAMYNTLSILETVCLLKEHNFNFEEVSHYV